MNDRQHPLTRANELVDLAWTYAQDGAFFTAAERLREAAEYMKRHAENCRVAEGASR